jgi:hypothetical protein
MKVSDILTLLAILAMGASGYFAWEAWNKAAGKPFNDEARNPKSIRYPITRTSRSPMEPVRKQWVEVKKTREEVLANKEAELADLTQQRNTLQDENKVLSEEILTATTQKQSLQEKIRDKRREIQENAEKIRNYEEKLAATGDPDELKARVRDNIARLTQADQTLALEKQNLEAALQRDANLKSNLADAREVERKQTAGEMEPDFRSTVREVFGRWGFVVINGGASQGVNQGTKLDVIRGGEKIAQLQVSTVEPTVSVCAVVRDSMAADMMLVPGDKVMVSRVVASAPPVVQPEAGAVLESLPAPAAAPAAAAEEAPEPAMADPVDPFN